MIFMTKFAIIAINLTERKADSMYNIAVCDDSPMDREHLIERIKSMDVQQGLCIHEFSSGTIGNHEKYQICRDFLRYTDGGNEWR